MAPVWDIVGAGKGGRDSKVNLEIFWLPCFAALVLGTGSPLRLPASLSVRLSGGVGVLTQMGWTPCFLSPEVTFLRSQALACWDRGGIRRDFRFTMAAATVSLSVRPKQLHRDECVRESAHRAVQPQKLPYPGLRWGSAPTCCPQRAGPQ